jgi:hypothetical protein
VLKIWISCANARSLAGGLRLMAQSILIFPRAIFQFIPGNT